MRKYIYIGVVIFFALIGMWVNSRLVDQLKSEYLREVNNNKALMKEVDSIKTNSRVYKLKVDELSNLNDSLLANIRAIQKTKRIKDKNLHSINYIASKSLKIDTIVVKDTIFAPQTKIDTIIRDRWYSNHIQLKYPDTIITEPSFISEKYIVLHSRRETIKKPSPIFFIRWFQKKHTVIEVEVVDKNPYVVETNNKFIEIVR